MSEAAGPSVREAMAADPSIPIDPATLRLVIRDQRRPSRGLVYPWMRIVSRVAVYEHAVRCEYAHARLCQLRDRLAAPGTAGRS